jgi:copper chaperone CopZ
MELSELKGIESVHVDVNKNEIAVTIEPPASEQNIRDLLIEINYPSEV